MLTDCYWPARIVYYHFHKYSILKTKGFSDPIYPIRAVSHSTFVLAPSKRNPALLTAVTSILTTDCHTGLQPGAESIQWDGHIGWQQTGFPICTKAFKHDQRQNNILSAVVFDEKLGGPHGRLWWSLSPNDLWRLTRGTGILPSLGFASQCIL